jgi:PKD repeat protein
MTETWSTNGWADKNQFHLYHYFGDPAMKIWTEVPTQLSASHPAELIPGTTTIHLSGISADAVDATLCVGDELLQKVRVYGGSGTIHLPRPIELSDEDIVLTLSKQNYIPYISELQLSLPPVPLFGADVNEICAKESVQFTDSSLYDPDTWLWEVQPAGYIFVNSTENSQDPRIRFNLPGYYTISLTVSNHLGSETLTKQDYVLVKAIPDAPYADDRSRCFDDEIPALSSVGDNIRWFGSADLSDLLHEGAVYTPSSSPVGETDFYITQTVSGCESEAGVVSLVTYPATPVPEVFGSAICEYDTARFIARGTYLKWYTDSTGAELTALGDTLSWYPLPEGENTFFVSNTENECESGLVPCAVLVKPKPDKPVAMDTEVCQGEEVILEGEGENIYWYDNPDLQDPLYFGNSYKADISEPGEYTYYLTQEVGSCISDPEQVSASIYSLPVFSLGNDTTISYSDSISLGTTLDGQYLWNNGSMENNLEFVGSVYGLGTHTLWLEIVSPENCHASDTLVVSVERDSKEVSYYQFMGNIFNVYPNPVSDNLNIRFFQSIELPTRIILRDTMGNLALLEEFTEIEHGSFIELNISGISGGLYLLTIENESIVHTLPILVK